MARKIDGIVVFATFERADLYNWTDPANGRVKPLRSLKVLLAHGDGTVSRESVMVPDGLDTPSLTPGESYGFPCVESVSKKKLLVMRTLRTDIAPFPTPELQ